jgi:hypothetical protein
MTVEECRLAVNPKKVDHFVQRGDREIPFVRQEKTGPLTY